MEIRALMGNGAVTTDVTLHNAANRMVDERVGSLGVLDRDLLAGIITERDILRAAASGVDLGTATVFDWMTPRPDGSEPDMDVDDAARRMLATGFRHLPVVEGKPAARNGKHRGHIVVSNRTRPPMKPARGGFSQGNAPKGRRHSSAEPRQAKSIHVKSDQLWGIDPPSKRRIPPHPEADVSQSERDALTGLPFN